MFVHRNVANLVVRRDDFLIKPFNRQFVLGRLLPSVALTAVLLLKAAVLPISPKISHQSQVGTDVNLMACLQYAVNVLDVQARCPPVLPIQTAHAFAGKTM